MPKVDYSNILNNINEINSLNSQWNLSLVSCMHYDKACKPIFSIPESMEDFRISRLDYTRYRLLELLVDEIKRLDLKGSMAEVGVYKGDFSGMMNKLLPEKKLYLFDTFKGFTKKQIEDERQNENLNEKFLDNIGIFSNVTIEEVKEKMKYLNNCIFKVGLFPDTSSEIEDIFCLVSIDVDFYETTKAALRFFGGRLARKGYILVHDYNHNELFGAKKAVHEFLKENKCFNIVPLPDQGGSAILTK